MTIQEIIDWFGANPSFLVIYFIIATVISVIGLFFFKDKSFVSNLKYLYTVLIYGVVVPGMLSLILILYNLFVFKVNLLEVDIYSYYLPIVAAILNIVIIKKTTSLDKIPGFGRLSGLFMMVMIAFVITYILQRMFFGVFFMGGFIHLIGLFIVLLIGLRIGWKKIFY